MSVPDFEPPTADPASTPAGDAPESLDLPLADPVEGDERASSFLWVVTEDIPVVVPLAREVTTVARRTEVECWRCGWYDEPDYGRCARCDARFKRPRSRRPRRRSAGTGGPSLLAVVLISYALILFTTVAWTVAMLTGSAGQGEDDLLTGLGLVEAVDTGLVFLTLLIVGRVGLGEAPPGSWPFAWALSGPVLFVLICGNLLLSAFLRELFQVPLVPGPGVTIATILLICMQPAIIEELFFRHIALGAMRREMSLRAAIFVTSIMFAVAHIANPLGMPYLFVAGVVFGYARVYGGLPLSMLMRFLHNLAVISIDVPK